MSLYLTVLVLDIILLIYMVVKLKVHPVLALFVCGMLAGVCYNFGFIKTASLFTTGFGATLGGIGCTIIFGSIIACGIQDTGSIKSMVNFFIKLFRGKFLELTTAFAAFIMSIPVFGDITQVLVAPIVSMISRRKRITMANMFAWTGLGASLTHSIVPPTPGILAITIMFGADLGWTIVCGTLVSFISLMLCWALFRGWVSKEWIEPRPDFVVGVEPTDSTDYNDLLIKEEGLPHVVTAAMPILLPVVLISAASIAGITLPEDSSVRLFFATLGDRTIALFLGVICALWNGYRYRSKVIATNALVIGKEMPDLKEVMLNSWVVRALNVALLPLLITAMGGGFSTVIKAYPGIDKLGGIIASYSIPHTLVPFTIAAIMMLAVGSRTTAGMTAAAIVLPMREALGLSPLMATLLCGAGTMIGSHVSDSGFWVCTQLYNLNTKQGLKYVTFLGSMCGIFAYLALMGLNAIGFVQ